MPDACLAEQPPLNLPADTGQGCYCCAFDLPCRPDELSGTRIPQGQTRVPHGRAVVESRSTIYSEDDGQQVTVRTGFDGAVRADVVTAAEGIG